MRNWTERIESLDRRVSVNIRPVSGDFIASVSTLSPVEIHKAIWQDIYPTFEEAKQASFCHASKPFSELEGSSWQNC